MQFLFFFVLSVFDSFCVVDVVVVVVFVVDAVIVFVFACSYFCFVTISETQKE